MASRVGLPPPPPKTNDSRNGVTATPSIAGLPPPPPPSSTLVGTTTPISSATSALPTSGSGLMVGGIPYDQWKADQSVVPDMGTASDTSLVTTSTDATDDIGALTKNMYDALGAAQAASINSATESAANALVKALSTSLSNLTDAGYGIKDSYYAKKNQAAAQSDIGKVNYAQRAAAQGIRGNASMQNELYTNLGLQNSITSLNKGEAADTASIERQKVLARNGLESDLAALYAKRDFELAEAGNTVEAQRTQATIDQILADADAQVAEEAQVKKDFVATLGRFYGKEQEAITQIKGDGDTSNDWQIQWLEAALAERLNAKPTGGGGGTGLASNQTFASLDDQLNGMYKLYTKNGEILLTDEGKAAMYNYVSQYGGKYAAQLAAKYGLSAPKSPATTDDSRPGATPNTNTAPAVDYDSVARTASRKIEQGGTKDAAAGYLADQVERGTITTAQAQKIAASLGIL